VPASTEDEQYAIRAIDRAIDVLMGFTGESPVQSLGEVAANADLSKPTTFRILSSLRRRGFIAQSEHGDYSLGFEIVGLAEVRKGQTKIWDEALPYMRKIRDAIDETVLLCIRVNDDRYILDQVESTHPIRRVAKIGEHVPLYVGAASRILLAAMDDSDIESYLQRTSLTQLRPGTLTDVEQLKRELDSVRQLGYAIGNNERNVGGSGIAVGIRDYSGRTVAALQVTVPTERWTDHVRVRCLAVLSTCAGELSRQLGERSIESPQHNVNRRTQVRAGKAARPHNVKVART
jgi:DNA-binding IclR family transcriptional regulator